MFVETVIKYLAIFLGVIPCPIEQKDVHYILRIPLSILCCTMFYGPTLSMLVLILAPMILPMFRDDMEDELPPYVPISYVTREANATMGTMEMTDLAYDVALLTQNIRGITKLYNVFGTVIMVTIVLHKMKKTRKLQIKAFNLYATDVKDNPFYVEPLVHRIMAPIFLFELLGLMVSTVLFGVVRCRSLSTVKSAELFSHQAQNLTNMSLATFQYFFTIKHACLSNINIRKVIDKLENLKKGFRTRKEMMRTLYESYYMILDSVYWHMRYNKLMYVYVIMTNIHTILGLILNTLVLSRTWSYGNLWQNIILLMNISMAVQVTVALCNAAHQSTKQVMFCNENSIYGHKFTLKTFEGYIGQLFFKYRKSTLELLIKNIIWISATLETKEFDEEKKSLIVVCISYILRY